MADTAALCRFGGAPDNEFVPWEREATHHAGARQRVTTKPSRGRKHAREELRSSAARARRSEVALVSSYLRALRRLGEGGAPAPRPGLPH